jgi:hypothetical protein
MWVGYMRRPAVVLGMYTLRARQSANRRQRNCNKVLFGFPNNFAYCLIGKVCRSRIRLAHHVHRVKRFHGW